MLLLANKSFSVFILFNDCIIKLNTLFFISLIFFIVYRIKKIITMYISEHKSREGFLVTNMTDLVVPVRKKHNFAG